MSKHMSNNKYKTTVKIGGIDHVENLKTGVIYKITNKINGKIYIGKAYSYVKHNKIPFIRFGANGRFKRHISNAYSENILLRNECPLFYKAIRQYGKNSFNFETLEVCLKKNLKNRETLCTKKYKSYIPEIGYNILIGDNKPDEGLNKTKYEIKKIQSNKDRCKDGSQRRSNETSQLPSNIYRVWRNKKSGKYMAGYKIQIKIKNKIYTKGFTQNKLTLEEKLKMAKKELKKIQKLEKEPFLESI